jgi:hypothetical protein
MNNNDSIKSTLFRDVICNLSTLHEIATNNPSLVGSKNDLDPQKLLKEVQDQIESLGVPPEYSYLLDSNVPLTDEKLDQINTFLGSMITEIAFHQFLVENKFPLRKKQNSYEPYANLANRVDITIQPYTCPICFEDADHRNSVQILCPGVHPCHKTCADLWFDNRRAQGCALVCPVCNNTILQEAVRGLRRNEEDVRGLRRNEEDVRGLRRNEVNGRVMLRLMGNVRFLLFVCGIYALQLQFSRPLRRWDTLVPLPWSRDTQANVLRLDNAYVVGGVHVLMLLLCFRLIKEILR